MAKASIPVDLFNPGQVLASLGFLEAADVLLGDAQGGFDLTTAESRFLLSATGAENPFAVVLRFLAEAKVVEWVPVNYARGGATNGDDEDADESDDGEENSTAGDDDEVESDDEKESLEVSEIPCKGRHQFKPGAFLENRSRVDSMHCSRSGAPWSTSFQHFVVPGRATW